MTDRSQRMGFLPAAGEPVAGSDPRVSEPVTFYDYAIIAIGWALLLLWAFVGVTMAGRV